MASTTGSERTAVQNPLISYVQEPEATYKRQDGSQLLSSLGWEYVSHDEAIRKREGENNLIFREEFVNQLQKLNPNTVDHLWADEVRKQLERLQPTKEGNLKSWEYLKGMQTVFVEEEKQERNIRLLDTENINRNIFQVTDELSFNNGKHTTRCDVAFFINGIPLLLVETKAAKKLEGIAESLDQIRRYHEQTPEMLAMLQVYALTHIIRFYYSATWNHTRKLLYNWKDESAGDDYEGLVKTFFDKKRIIQLLTDFILFTREDDELKKIVLRPHQMRAVNRLVSRAGEEDKTRALVWHTQGSGKTYTMITTAELLLQNPSFQNPTVLLLVDRNELETQLFGNLDAIGKQNFVMADTKKHLKELLKDDRRGLIISTIHKFDKMEADVNTRHNIFILIDEAHRTTGGKLGNYLMGALPNSTMFGFTGTPIDKTSTGQNTFLTFGKDDPSGYIDKYSIAESIEDKTTVKLHYSLAPNELRIPRETLHKEFFSLAEAEGVSDVEELNKTLEKAVNLRNMLKNRDRVGKITKNIVDHYQNNVEPLGYKAFIVTTDREACTFYKEELDKHLSPDYSEVVFSPNHNDPQELRQYHLSDDQEKQIRKNFRTPDQKPKILIVTEKLLTGFDAPILYCMYLDKPMRDHVLLQAIARVNRPYEDQDGKEKPSGLVIDYVGIFDNLEKALQFESTDIEGVVEDINILKEAFEDKIEEARQNYLNLIPDEGQPDKNVEKVLDHFREEEKREKFYQFFRIIRDMYDIISPDEFMRPYVEDIEKLGNMHRIVREAYNPSISIDRDFSRKTAQLVQDKAETYNLKPTLDVYEINDNTLKKIEETQTTDTEKIFNLIKSVKKTIEEKGDQEPHLLSIAEKADAVVEQFERRQKNTKEALEEMKRVIEEINQARKEQAEKNMPVDLFTIFWEFKSNGIQNPEDKANQLREVVEQHHYWHNDQRQEKKVRQQMYKVLLQTDQDGNRPDVSEMSKLVEQIIRNFKTSKRD